MVVGLAFGVGVVFSVFEGIFRSLNCAAMEIWEWKCGERDI
jgi:hypothetical protein